MRAGAHQSKRWRRPAASVAEPAMGRPPRDVRRRKSPRKSQRRFRQFAACLADIDARRPRPTGWPSILMLWERPAPANTALRTRDEQRPLRPVSANKAPDAKSSAESWAYFAPRLLRGLPRASDFRGSGDNGPWMQGTQLATSMLYEFTRLILHPQRACHARLAARRRRLDAPDFDAGLLEHAS